VVGGAAGAGDGENAGADPIDGVAEVFDCGAGTTCVTMIRLWILRRSTRRACCWVRSVVGLTVARAGSCPFASCCASPPKTAKKTAAETAAIACAGLTRRPRRVSVVFMLGVEGLVFAFAVVTFEAVVVLARTGGTAGTSGDGLGCRRRCSCGLETRWGRGCRCDRRRWRR
jgi:hypothetical protein